MDVIKSVLCVSSISRSSIFFPVLPANHPDTSKSIIYGYACLCVCVYVCMCVCMCVYALARYVTIIIDLNIFVGLLQNCSLRILHYVVCPSNYYR
jgi:hypothetical protein